MKDLIKNELVSRIIFGTLLFAIVVAISWLDEFYVRILIGLTFAYALYEWLHLCIKKMDFALYSQYLVMFAILFGISIMSSLLFNIIVYALALVWMVAILALVLDSKYLENTSITLPIGAFLIAGGLIGLERIFPYHLVAISIAVVADTCAYFVGKYLAGKYFERHLLAPSISPKKTWEGAVGGFLGVLILCIAFDIAGIFSMSFLKVLLVSVVLYVVAAFGDLLESKIKRISDIKDSGNILPGHGGLLDRIDALIAVVPFLLIVHTFQ